jgi:hypothetical protein
MANLPHITRFGLPESGGGLLKEVGVVIEAWPPSQIMIELVRQVKDTQMFLRMAVIELRRIADQGPHIAPGSGKWRKN